MSIHSGYIRKRKNKTGTSYQVVVEMPPDPLTGKRERPSKTVSSKKEAERLLAQWLHELNNKTYIGENNTVLKNYMEDWLKIYIEPHTAATTFMNYEMQIRPRSGLALKHHCCQPKQPR